MIDGVVGPERQAACLSSTYVRFQAGLCRRREDQNASISSYRDKLGSRIYFGYYLKSIVKQNRIMNVQKNE